MGTEIHPMLRMVFYFGWFFLITLVANLLFILTSMVIMPFNELLAYTINSHIAFFLWDRMQYVFEYRHGALITFSGDVIPPNESAIVVANHLSYSDFYLINGLAARKRMLPYGRWFVKSSLKWQLPIFGWSMYLIGMVMVTRDWLRDSESISQAFKGLKQPSGVGKKVWLVSFLEGTRLTPEKLEKSQKYCRDDGKVVLKNVLAARTKGFIAAVRELRNSHVTHVYDLTLAYTGPDGFGKAPDLVTINSLSHLSPKYKFHIHTRRWAISDLPVDEGELKIWIETVWQEKDELLEGLKTEWINWKGLVGWGAKTAGQSGACGVYRDSLYAPPAIKAKFD
ncbi:hypothetical protein MJO28_000099 [Puccinia striiformis f. sp. tritici]|uniref:Phospholipid/glycerol acyltransferase domain-containing protein n=2 Tax=Puccinia striiformis f. sp. tritici TaxID=168172 RepID=A0A0L0V104_9BASI|nr:hypothetical protein Pst134EA_001103 [Puccinia striiformis f. sp. tritici]KAI9625022.1 hypothetical protein H4Q26_016590 [Puccinia striiformis f. sp. tritici PST-130]KNE92876.1 hypothetical protein PSTG_13725 [Puccinia striiformis f. sp. tritici PST-78]KAH9467328.1 hypothetical protein Pst134EB_002347 [Puccinia striiformis f. sp. tritici]KAH9474052.1 hypothetical protein Pst134EA_001103 [Puccinia striiformis f. sp. tritici]KAI7962005.1 hypothetical protein MJO28_000099 [Puccinia striiformis